MKNFWVKWLILVSIATFPYNVLGMLLLIFPSKAYFEAVIWNLCYLFFVTLLAKIDYFLIGRRLTQVSQALYQAIFVKLFISIMGIFVMMLFLGEYKDLFDLLWMDMWLKNHVLDMLREQFKPVSPTFFDSTFLYQIIKDITSVVTLLAVELFMIVACALGVLAIKIVYYAFTNKKYGLGDEQ